MARKNPPAKWVLPDVINPPTSTCWMVPVPDDPKHKAAFLGALADLCAAYKWQDDTAHTAKSVARVWREIVDNLKECDVCDPTFIGADEGDENMIRQNPDNPCELQSSVNGTDWCTFADFSLCIPDLGSPTGTQPQPTPGGGCQTYKYNSLANQQWLLPYPVNAGDVITISNSSGAASDPTSGGGLGIEWFCINGALYFAGACVGAPQFDGADVLPSAPHMSLVCQINGTWYPLTGGVLTVPGGIVNGTCLFQLNGSSVYYLYTGSSKFDVEVCNNTAATWSHTFDFTLSPDGWSVVGGVGVWTAGVGFQSVLSGGVYDLEITRAFTAVTLTSHTIVYDRALAGDPTNSQDEFYIHNPTLIRTYQVTPAPASAGISPVYRAFSHAACTDATLDFNTWTVNEVTTVPAITLTGTGVNPF